MRAQTLLTPAARRHIRLLAKAILPVAGRLERRFGAILRERRYDPAHVRAILSITLVAAARARGMGQFFEAVAYHGKRLARLNMELDEVNALLSSMGEVAEKSSPASTRPPGSNCNWPRRTCCRRLGTRFARAKRRCFMDWRRPRPRRPISTACWSES